MKYLVAITRYFLLILLLPGIPELSAQLSAPVVNAVYGGRIRAITSIPISADTSLIYITTESANSAFFSHVFHDLSLGISLENPFQVMPGLDDAAGYGQNIEQIGAHATSEMMFFIKNGELMKTHFSTSNVDTISQPGVQSFAIVDDHLLYIQANQLHFGSLNTKGSFTANSDSPFMLPESGDHPQIAIHPISRKVYVFLPGLSPKLYRLESSVDSLSASVSISNISPIISGTTPPWTNFGISPDGSLFLAGSDFVNKWIAVSVDETSWTTVNTGIGGASGSNLAFGGDSSSFSVYYGSIYSTNKGLPGSWHNFGNPGGFETHPNDGPVFVDPINTEMVYLSSDQGIAVSMDQGPTIFEINQGVEAVQVRDFDMTSDKETAWLASKSGIRKVSNYRTSPTWKGPIFPNGDGSPYYATAMEPGDTNTVYACNLRVYKTSDGGTLWNRQFSAEDAPYNFPSSGNNTTAGARIVTAEVCEYDPQILMVGYEIEWGGAGGLFASHDGGNTWDQVLLHASVVGLDVNVNDILFQLESGDTVAYVGVTYNLDNPTGRSVYRLTKMGAIWNVDQDMDGSSTSVGYSITATIQDLAKSSTGDTLFACGTDAGINHPITYYKPLNSTGLWTPFSTNGFPFVSGKQAKAITIGVDTVYCAVDNEVYFIPTSDSVWTLGYSYPIGTEINFLYFDELLVGTGTGLYGHNGISSSTTSIWNLRDEPVKKVKVFPNPSHNQIVTIEVPFSHGKPYSLTIRTLTGQVIVRNETIWENRIQMDPSHFPAAGIYLIEIDGYEKFNGKLIVD